MRRGATRFSKLISSVLQQSNQKKHHLDYSFTFCRFFSEDTRAIKMDEGEVIGEGGISKNELKRRLKAAQKEKEKEEKAAAKAAKAAAAPPKPAGDASNAADDDIDPSK
jgi:hypothetical protein